MRKCIHRPRTDADGSVGTLTQRLSLLLVSRGKGPWLILLLCVGASAGALIFANSGTFFHSEQSPRGQRLSDLIRQQNLSQPPAPRQTSSTPKTNATLGSEAIEVGERLVRDFPHDADALAAMGMVHYRLGNSTEAMKWWKKCLEIEPDHAQVHRAMGEVALEKGERENNVAATRGSVAQAYTDASRVFRKHGFLREAEGHLRRAEELDP